MNQDMKFDEIKPKLIALINIKLKKDLNLNDQSMFEQSLLSKDIRFCARDLLYLFFEIEREFNIRISEEDVVSGNFKSLDKIVETIGKHIEKNESKTA